VVVSAIDQRHVHGQLGQRSSHCETPETAAYHHDLFVKCHAPLCFLAERGAGYHWQIAPEDRDALLQLGSSDAEQPIRHAANGQP
jgi:hypothetical protein